MINGITYYKMKSPYEGDITKNCALTGTEVDNNFFVLEGRDVKSISVEGNDIVLNLVNGESLKAKDAFDNFITNVEFDEKDGILKIYRNNGDIECIHGFVTSWAAKGGITSVATDSSLVGNGLPSKPIGISPSSKTGQYKPVLEYVVKKCSCGCDNDRYNHPNVGDRFITEEQISNFGLLYDYKTVSKIACDLQKAHSKWRIPSKDDWDDMLNAIEPCKSDRNHNSGVPNHFLGKWAGKLLKSTDLWLETEEGCGCGDDCCGNDNCSCNKGNSSNDFCEEYFDKCGEKYCGEINNCYPIIDDTEGVDKYGFRVTPAGYSDDAYNSLFFKTRAYFWTATNMKFVNAFIKRFDYNKNRVYQDIVAGQNFFSLRLVKDYDGDNFNENEEILGQNYPTVLMPSLKNGKSIWTSVNVYFTNPNYKSVTPNNGQDLTFIKKYFIDEWNGKKWIRNEVKEGESVVIKNSPDGKRNVEYRINNGELVSVSKEIYDNVIENVGGDLSRLNDKIEKEIERSTIEDASINEHVNHVETTLSDFAKETNKAFEIINDNLVQSINTINSAIETEKNERITEDNNIKDEISDIKKEAETHVKFTDVSTEQNPNRKAIILKNHDIILGTDTNGSTFNLAMLSKWNKADFGSNKIEFNINSSERPTVNDTEKIAYLNDINELDNDYSKEISKLKETDILLQSNIDNEALLRKEKDIEIEGKLLKSDGCEFDTNKGVLKLKSQDGTNDVEIQFTMNFGNF